MANKVKTQRRAYGEHAGLYVEIGDKARGTTHCMKCGGRTLQRNAKGKALHYSCGGTKRKRVKPA